MVRALLVSVLCLNLVGCGLPKSHSKTDHEFLITPGIGIKNLSLNYLYHIHEIISSKCFSENTH